MSIYISCELQCYGGGNIDILNHLLELEDYIKTEQEHRIKNTPRI